MKTSEYINRIMSVANDLRKVVESTTPDTFDAERDKVLTKYGLENELGNLTYG